MTAEQLEIKWQSITPVLSTPYRALLLDSACIPELYMALDIRNNRALVLKVPMQTAVNCRATLRENLAIEWHPKTRFLLISLHNSAFHDLFNDFTLSLYNRIKNMFHAEAYTLEFIAVFHKWAEFFENAASQLLSEPVLKGLFGELLVLRFYLTGNTGLTADQVLNAWQGPFNRAQDFIFTSYNAEVKTKDKDEVTIHISSEFQLEPEAGKSLSLAVVSVVRQQDGINVQQLMGEIRNLLIQQGGDLSAFIRLVARAGLNFSDTAQYNSFIWKLEGIEFFDAGNRLFPRIISAALTPGITGVSYELNVVNLAPFITQTYIP